MQSLIRLFCQPTPGEQLQKYADEGVQEIENIHVLKVKPFDELGSPLEIVKKGFGNKQAYLQAVNDLETEIYQLPSRSA